MASWFEITFTGEPTTADLERASELVLQGFTSGQLLGDHEDEMAGIPDAGPDYLSEGLAEDASREV